MPCRFHTILSEAFAHLQARRLLLLLERKSLIILFCPFLFLPSPKLNILLELFSSFSVKKIIQTQFGQASPRTAMPLLPQPLFSLFRSQIPKSYMFALKFQVFQQLLAASSSFLLSILLVCIAFLLPLLSRLYYLIYFQVSSIFLIIFQVFLFFFKNNLIIFQFCL